MGFKEFVFLSAIIVLGFSCSDPGMMGGASKEGGVSIITMPEGSIKTSNSTIPISLEYRKSEVSPDRMEIRLFNSSGRIIGNPTVLGADVISRKRLPDLSLPALNDGMYTIEFLIYQKGSLLSQKSVPFFCSKNRYRLLRISTYPPTLTPSSTALLRVYLDVPSNSNPYLRWSYGDNNTIYEGFLSKGADRIQWKVPENKGIYSVKVELFPFGSSKHNGFSFSSPVFMQAEIVISETSGALRNELGPEKDYFSLFHFNGKITDRGYRTGKSKINPIGRPDFEIKNNLFGCHLDGSTGLRVNNALLPAFSDGSLKPFSLSMRILLDDPLKTGIQEKKYFFRYKSENTDFEFNIFTDSRGIINAEIGGSDTRTTTNPGDMLLVSGKIHNITFSVNPGKTSTEFFWFLNGNLVSHEKKPVSQMFVGRGKSIIGGSRGFIGLIDEFGIFSSKVRGKISIDPYVYKRQMIEKNGKNLLYAEGFDGLYIPDNLVYDNTLKRKPVVKKGALVLPPGTSLKLPGFSIDNEICVFEIDFSSNIPSGKNIIILKHNREVIASFDSKGRITTLNGGVLMARVHGNVIKFELEQSINGLKIRSGRNELILKSARENTSKVRMSLHNPSKKKRLEVRSILILRENVRLARKELNPSIEKRIKEL